MNISKSFRRIDTWFDSLSTSTQEGIIDLCATAVIGVIALLLLQL